MKLVYEPANAIEAHMILNLFEQAGLSGRIDGEFLQGGVGDLQTAGYIRLMVEEADYEAASKIVKEWDQRQPIDPIKETPKRTHPLFAGFMGLCIGLASLTVYYNTSTTTDGIDYNGDGKLDEKWMYVRDRISKTEVDRNLDGKVDQIYQFNRKGRIKSASSDDNFDEIFETDSVFLNGNIKWSKSDTTGDGYQDYQIFFINGLFEQVKFMDPASDRPLKIQTYNAFKLSRAEFDSNHDGQLDTTYLYDDIEEISKVGLINKK